MATTTEYPLEETTNDLPMYADFIAAPVSSMSPAAIEQLQHNQITFEIPSAHDLKHIDALHTFNKLLQRIGNVAYDTAQQQLQRPQQHQIPLAHDAVGQAITTEQIAKSVVLDLADLQSGTTSSAMERFFADADMHAIINYLWIGVVTSLIILSVVFILFSCYFYRKFREWKKCNKDIRTQLHNDLYAGANGLHSTCDHRLLNANGQPAGSADSAGAGGGVGGDAAFYQIESPPCYTIATGLPTYDEALHHQHHRQHQHHQAAHFSYGMKFMYPSIAAVHHHQHAALAAANISNWEKQDQLTMQRKVKQEQQQQQQPHKQQKSKMSTETSVQPPPAYADAAAAAAATIDAQASLLVAAAAVEKISDGVCYIAMPADNSNTLSSLSPSSTVTAMTGNAATNAKISLDDDCSSSLVVVVA